MVRVYNIHTKLTRCVCVRLIETNEKSPLACCKRRHFYTLEYIVSSMWRVWRTDINRLNQLTRLYYYYQDLVGLYFFFSCIVKRVQVRIVNHVIVYTKYVFSYTRRFSFSLRIFIKRIAAISNHTKTLSLHKNNIDSTIRIKKIKKYFMLSDLYDVKNHVVYLNLIILRNY